MVTALQLYTAYKLGKRAIRTYKGAKQIDDRRTKRKRRNMKKQNLNIGWTM